MASRLRRRVALAFAALAVAACSRRADVAAAPPLAIDGAAVRVPAPTMGWEGADWLERPEREAEEQPERVLDVLELSPGETVADVGAGTGYFALRIARRVAPNGRVLATDIQPEMLARLRANAADAGTGNIEPILATADDARLPEGAVDLALMVDVYHELAHPAATLAQVRRALRPAGRLVLVEYRGEDPTVPIKPEHEMTLAQARAEVEPCGFVFQRSYEFLRWQHVIVFTRARG